VTLLRAGIASPRPARKGAETGIERAPELERFAEEGFQAYRRGDADFLGPLRRSPPNIYMLPARAYRTFRANGVEVRS
jgi:hypothetical protein